MLRAAGDPRGTAFIYLFPPINNHPEPARFPHGAAVPERLAMSASRAASGDQQGQEPVLKEPTPLPRVISCWVGVTPTEWLELSLAI